MLLILCRYLQDGLSFCVSRNPDSFLFPLWVFWVYIRTKRSEVREDQLNNLWSKWCNTGDILKLYLTKDLKIIICVCINVLDRTIKKDLSYSVHQLLGQGPMLWCSRINVSWCFTLISVTVEFEIIIKHF